MGMTRLSVRQSVAERRVPMEASKLLAGCLLWLTASACLAAQDATPPPSTQPPSTEAAQSSERDDSGSAKAESSPHRSVHHIQVPIEDSQPPELTEAEASIEKKNYAAAEPLLRKLVERDPASYVGWFDLGFVENALGKVDDSIAAFR